MKKAAVKKAGVKKKAAAPARKAAVKARAKTAAKKAAPKKAAPRKVAAAKKSAARVPAARRTTTRRTRQAPPPRRKAAAPRLRAAAPAQHFTASHLNNADFKPDGLRSYALYRDLGIAAASGGLCQAHVIRMLSPCTDEVRKRHQHDTELQLIYVLQGWIKNEFEGEGVQMMSAGSCWLQPPGIKHTVLDYSADIELLEIIVPADFKTVELD
ncbi:MAG TPA: cupin domain-containing protein [Acetobacteraceae bacterium]|nr:cupin domain-containing protein [Acetobacteraceae bacterium]